MKRLNATVVPFFVFAAILLVLPKVKYIVNPPKLSLSVNFSYSNEKSDVLKGLYSVYFTLNNNHGRLGYMYDMYGREYINSTDSDHLVTTMNDPYSPIYFKNVLPTQKYSFKHSVRYGNANKDRLTKRMTTFEYCLSQPDCRWVLSLADDAYMQLQNTRTMLEELENSYDPLVEPVIIGHCIDKNTKYVYLQGGTGYLASRQAAKLLLEQYQTWTYDLSVPDDVMFTDGLQSAGITVYESSSRFFSGHNTPYREYSQVMSSHYSNLPRCPQKGYFKYCGGGNEQANKLAVIHSCIPSNGLCPQAKILLEAPDHVKFYNQWDDVHICS